MEDQSFDLIRQVMMACGRYKMTHSNPEHAKVLVATFGPERIGKLLTGVGKGEPNAVEWLQKYMVICALRAKIASNGFPGVTLPNVIALIRSYNVERLQATVNDAAGGDGNARAVLSGWIAKVVPDSTQSTTQWTPVYATPLPPPTDNQQQQTPDAVQNVQQRPTASTFQPATLRPMQVQRADVPQHDSNAYRQAPTPPEPTPAAQHSNVSKFRSRDVAPSDANRPSYDQVAAYGNNVAIQFERSPTKDRTTTTINIKCAMAKDGGKTRHGCDWQRAITLMMTPHEIQLVLAVIMGYLPKFRAAGHGEANEKWFEVTETSEGWAGSIRFTVAQGKGQQADIRNVNVTPNDVGQVAAIFMRAARDQLKLTDTLLLSTVRRAADLYTKASTARAQRAPVRRVG